MSVPDRKTRGLLRDILDTCEYEIPRGGSFEGSGAPGLYLEHLLGLETSNRDIPDAGAWELKFSGGNSLLTLFHKTPQPHASMRYIVNRWGWTGRNGRQSFRHTICGQSDRFEVFDEANAIRVRRTGHDDVAPWWHHDDLITAFARKLGKLILVGGKYTPRTRIVRYESAEYLSEARTTNLIRAIVSGQVCIDFDAYIRESGAVRDHGTKFRIKPEDLRAIYSSREAAR
ncbi:MAG: hypothetical protein F4X76_02640 [Chloroflexi bacterium]|nr:hypothetical protein [Chloroflexota bacterium]